MKNLAYSVYLEPLSVIVCFISEFSSVSSMQSWPNVKVKKSFACKRCQCVNFKIKRLWTTLCLDWRRNKWFQKQKRALLINHLFSLHYCSALYYFFMVSTRLNIFISLRAWRSRGRFLVYRHLFIRHINK